MYVLPHILYFIPMTEFFFYLYLTEMAPPVSVVNSCSWSGCHFWCIFLNKSALPAFLQKLVDQDNHKFEEWCNEMADMRQQSVNKGKAKHEEVKKLYKLLPTKDGQ